jgi:hypothetical protein
MLAEATFRLNFARRLQWSPLSSNRSDFAALFTWSPQFKRQTKHKTGGLRVRRGSLLQASQVRHSPIWACEKDVYEARTYTLQIK